MNTTTSISVKDVCRMVCNFAMKTSKVTVSASEFAHTNGHTYEDATGHTSVAAHWSPDGDVEQVYVNICFLNSGNGYAFRMNRERIWDDRNNEVRPESTTFVSTCETLMSIVQKAMDAQNEIIATARLHDTERVGAIPA